MSANTLTPEQRARAAIAECGLMLTVGDDRRLEGAVSAAIRAAVEAETERCAQEADSFVETYRQEGLDREAVAAGAIALFLRSTASKDSKEGGR